MKTLYLLLIMLTSTLWVYGQNYNANTGKLIIEFSKVNARKTNFLSLEKKYGHINAQLHSLTSDNRIAMLKYDADEVNPDKLMQNLRSSGMIHSVQMDYQLDLRSTPPNDNLLDDQWYLDMINASDAWNLSIGGTNIHQDTIVIAVIDDGFDIGHEDLIQNIWINRKEIPNDGIDNDDNGFIDDYYGWNFDSVDGQLPKKIHGTSVLGLIGAKGNNRRGIAGMNWNVKLMPISIPGSISSLISAFDYVRQMRQLYNETNGEKGAFIVASSYSGGKNFRFARDNPLWCSMYDKLGEVGILSIGATTNLNADVEVFGDMPSTCPSDYLVIVTSTDQIDSKLIGAGYGAVSIDIGAPGINLMTTHIDNVYHNFSGTSAATPLVTGAVGLLYSIPNRNIAESTKTNPAETALKIKSYLLDGAFQIDDLANRSVSGGRLDLGSTIRQLRVDNGSPKGGIQLINVYPNPASEIVNMTYQIDDLQQIHLSAYNNLGQIIYEEKKTPDEFPLNNQVIDTSNWPIGYYYVKINQGNFEKTIKVSIIR